MSYLNLKQVANHLGVSEKTIYRLVDRGELPAFKVGRQWRFYKQEVESWLRKEKPEACVGDYFGDSVPSIDLQLSIYGLLKKNGIFLDIPGKSVSEVFKRATDIISLEPAVERGGLLSALIAREALCSTGIGHGIALPHPRYPHKFAFANSSVALCFLENGVDFEAIDKASVDKLFFVFGRDEKEHLRILRALAILFHDDSFMHFLNQRKIEEIMQSIKLLEKKHSFAFAD